MNWRVATAFAVEAVMLAVGLTLWFAVPNPTFAEAVRMPLGQLVGDVAAHLLAAVLIELAAVAALLTVVWWRWRLRLGALLGRSCIPSPGRKGAGR